MIKPKIKMDRVRTWYQEISALTQNAHGYTRLAFSDEEKAAHDWLIHKLEKLHCTVKVDRVHNVFGRMGAATGPSVAFGSHLDTVPNGGLFDGTLGVLAGLEILYTLSETDIPLDIPLELICFTGEEANPLGGTFGSRAIAGLVEVTKEYEQQLVNQGFTLEDLACVRKTKEDYLGFLELHIEQGAVLEQAHQKIGVVEGIAGMVRLAVQVHGRAAHAGTTPMSMRHDALVEAAQLVQHVNEWAREPKRQVVATVGQLNVFPNSPSVVPEAVQLIVEIRGIDWENVLDLKKKIEDWLTMSEQKQFKTIVVKHPAVQSQTIKEAIMNACTTRGIPFQRMVSGANHDTNAMSHLTDTGMIFVPSREGISHHPDEFTSWEAIETGIQIMFQSVINLLENDQKINEES
ncbi:M20 family metallo-hydrolase [Sporolactobacillus terrae]|uniref:M20 family metallo-hydrolase n=1 Tax=Sporolactobacillus terrae TaxID=269673 RepID=UPI00048CF42F|nr:M20 family metallo-hydrolase [Sporolactobacillus terrae]